MIRIVLGDAFGLHQVWQVGAFFNVLALVLFVVVAAWSAIGGEETKR